MDIPTNPGDILLGKYRIEKVLGKGGMGIVVAVQHVELGQRYAIKFLLPAVQAHPGAVERFLREARAAARLHSEHVARVHDVGYMENGLPYMVMEYLDGADLQQTLYKQGPLSSELALTYLSQVCDAIAEAHAAGIVHRDLKPANLFLIRRHNGTPCVKVLDFGISKHLEPTDGVDLTATHATMGSPLYMSPEQISKSKSVDPRSDIWALGVILYELISGKSPFLASTALEVVSRILQEEPTPIRQLRPDVSERAEGIIARCLQKQRDYRFQSIEELLAFLKDGPSAKSLAETAAAPIPPAPNSIPPVSATAPALGSNTGPGNTGPTSTGPTSTGPTITGPANTGPSITGPSGSAPISVAFGQTQPLLAQPPKSRTGAIIAATVVTIVVGGGLFGLGKYFGTQKETAASNAAPNASTMAAPAATSALIVAPAPAPIETTTATAPETSSSAGPQSKPVATSTAVPNRDSGGTTPTKKKRSAL